MKKYGRTARKSRKTKRTRRVQRGGFLNWLKGKFGISSSETTSSPVEPTSIELTTFSDTTAPKIPLTTTKNKNNVTKTTDPVALTMNNATRPPPSAPFNNMYRPEPSAPPSVGGSRKGRKGKKAKKSKKSRKATRKSC